MEIPTDANGFAQQGNVDVLRHLIDQAKNWPSPPKSRKTPHPLPPSLLPVAPFNFDLLPERLRPWTEDVCERLQCPPDYVAVSIMVGAGAVIGRKVAVRPQREDDWTLIVNQWALCIGRPGVMKSPAMDEALRPIKQLSAIAEEKFREEQASTQLPPPRLRFAAMRTFVRHPAS